MKKIINWGFIGLGNASYNLAKEFKNIDNSNLKAVASLQEKKRALFKDKFELEEKNIFSNYDDVISHPDIDIVYIGLPNSMHETYCFKALNFNKNVLVEKPITKNIQSFKELKRLSLKKNLLLEEGIANKFHPFYKKTLNEIKKLDFSKIIKIESSFGNDALGGKKIFGFRLKKVNYKKRLFNKNLDGGSILDGGIYPISLLLDIMEIFNETSEKKVITKCEKKISKNIDLESSLTLSYRNIEIKLKTSLTKNLENNFIIYTDKDVITLRNIFNISLESALEFKDNKNKNLYNLDKFNSYHYEIMNISNLLINRKIFENDSLDVSLKKIENKIELLSDWFEY